MYYSVVGLLAIMILIIENYDILFKKTSNIKSEIWQIYRRFLFAVLIYKAPPTAQGQWVSAYGKRKDFVYESKIISSDSIRQKTKGDL